MHQRPEGAWHGVHCRCDAEADIKAGEIVGVETFGQGLVTAFDYAAAIEVVLAVVVFLECSANFGARFIAGASCELGVQIKVEKADLIFEIPRIVKKSGL